MVANRLAVAGLFVAASVSCLAPSVARAQKRPFPQNAGYPNGFLPRDVTASDAISSYNSWKTKYLKSDCGEGYYRVEFTSPMGTTVSEGMGYGMVLTAYFGDQALFDGLWKFVRKNFNKDGLMGWNVTCSGFNQNSGGPEGSATDGDEDIGFALVAAVEQWGESYRPVALDYLAKLKKVEFETCEATGRVMAKAGNWGGGCDFSNSSYWTPGYYRVFQEFTGDTFWGKAADSANALYLLNRNPITGLVANEVDEHGVTHGKQSYVDYNGCRTPWRAVADYLWYGTADAKDATDKITDWARSIGVARIVDGYNTDGTPTANAKYTQQNSWVGGFACGAMSKSQSAVDTFAADFKWIPNDEGGYYGSSLRTLYLLMLSGNFWKPGPKSVAIADARPAPPRVETASAPTAAVGPGVSTERTPPVATRGGCGCRAGGADLALRGLRTEAVEAAAAIAALLALVARRRRG